MADEVRIDFTVNAAQAQAEYEKVSKAQERVGSTAKTMGADTAAATKRAGDSAADAAKKFHDLGNTERVLSGLKAASLNLRGAIEAMNPAIAKTVGGIANMADGGADALQQFQNLQKATTPLEKGIAGIGVVGNLASVALEGVNLAIDRINNNKLTGIDDLDAGLREVLGLAHESGKALLELRFPEGTHARAELLANATKVLGVEVKDVAKAVQVLDEHQRSLGAENDRLVEKTERVKEAIAKGWTEADKYTNSVDQNIAAMQFLTKVKEEAARVGDESTEALKKEREELDKARAASAAYSKTRDEGMVERRQAAAKADEEAAQAARDRATAEYALIEIQEGRRQSTEDLTDAQLELLDAMLDDAGYTTVTEGSSRVTESTDEAAESIEAEGEAAEEAAESKRDLADSEHDVADGADEASSSVDESAESLESWFNKDRGGQAGAGAESFESFYSRGPYGEGAPFVPPGGGAGFGGPQDDPRAAALDLFTSAGGQIDLGGTGESIDFGMEGEGVNRSRRDTKSGPRRVRPASVIENQISGGRGHAGGGERSRAGRLGMGRRLSFSERVGWKYGGRNDSGLAGYGGLGGGVGGFSGQEQNTGGEGVSISSGEGGLGNESGYDAAYAAGAGVQPGSSAVFSGASGLGRLMGLLASYVQGGY